MNTFMSKVDCIEWISSSIVTVQDLNIEAELDFINVSLGELLDELLTDPVYAIIKLYDYCVSSILRLNDIAINVDDYDAILNAFEVLRITCKVASRIYPILED